MTIGWAKGSDEDDLLVDLHDGVLFGQHLEDDVNLGGVQHTRVRPVDLSCQVPHRGAVAVRSLEHGLDRLAHDLLLLLGGLPSWRSTRDRSVASDGAHGRQCTGRVSGSDGTRCLLKAWY